MYVVICSELGSAQELETLDPQKRELLEARIAGKVSHVEECYYHYFTQ